MADRGVLRTRFRGWRGYALAMLGAVGVLSFVVKPVPFDELARVTSQLELYWTLLNRPPVVGTGR